MATESEGSCLDQETGGDEGSVAESPPPDFLRAILYFHEQLPSHVEGR